MPGERHLGPAHRCGQVAGRVRNVGIDDINGDRVVIARALLNHPDLILADEPTGNLDPETSEGIMNLLFEISRSGSAVMMVTHNYPVIEKFPARIFKCENGKLIEGEGGRPRRDAP